tara:strand:- start:230 stop:679 length:450 start_codon:yes stop_codon:yes gene_type:complete
MVRSLTGKHPGYYEAVLQLRDVSQDVIDFVEKEIVKNSLSIVKFKKVKNGYDYFLSDNNLTKALGKKLQHHFGGELNITASLHTKKKDKELYRLTVLFREIKFKKLDKVLYQGDEYVVKGINREILLQNSKNGKKVRVKYKDMKRIKKE